MKPAGSGDQKLAWVSSMAAGPAMAPFPASESAYLTGLGFTLDAGCLCSSDMSPTPALSRAGGRVRGSDNTSILFCKGACGTRALLSVGVDTLIEDGQSPVSSDWECNRSLGRVRG